jgi:cytoskeletal protein RodZ
VTEDQTSSLDHTSSLDLPDRPEAPADNPSTRRWIGFGLLAVGVAILLSAGWVSWRTYQAYHHLKAAAEQVSLLQAAVKNLDDIDLTKVDAAVAAMQSNATDARDATSDPLYRLAGRIPLLGPNLRAISDIARTVDGLAKTTAPSLIEVATSVQPSALAPKNGSIDVGPIARAADRLQAADAQVTAAITQMADIDRSQIVRSVADAANTLQSKLTSLHSTTHSAALIGRLAPPMLGAQGVRNYLVVFQNLAEPRATGGIFGSYALLNVNNGKLQIVDQGSGSRDIGTFQPPLALPAGMSPVLYGQLPGQYPTDVNLTPDFPTAAALIAKMYTARKHVQVDGVLALDPVTLSHLLVGLKPIDLGKGLTLTSSDISSLLMSKAYALYPNGSDAFARDAFLALATEKAFTAATGPQLNATTAVRGLRKGVAEHRILLWSTRPSEETDLLTTGIAGSLPTSDGSEPVIGVFRNDGTGGKLGYYASGSIALTAGSCSPSGQRNLTLTITMSYSAPDSGLSAYVLGYAKAGPYVLRTNVLVFAPLTGDLTALQVDGKSVPVVWAEQDGRKVGMITVDQKPGSPTAVVTGTLTIAAPPASSGPVTPTLLTTPGVTNWKSSSAGVSHC